MTIISDMESTPLAGRVKGSCAKCNADVYENLSLLDDAYNVWMGKCPHCNALNYLALVGLRGYTRESMSLVLPTDEEAYANSLPASTPTSGASGIPANAHGSNAGEIMHQLSKDWPVA